ncbi:hypothetical protein [Demequina sp. NBRC 110057]|uniref:hypothetical protein n=1 Tax=Demequina sp. NBRC 110057 TaxID=1570346 RepID=UPI001356497C|nr:hypothetical protein [Demequina sp. NBRC 110057]
MPATTPIEHAPTTTARVEAEPLSRGAAIGAALAGTGIAAGILLIAGSHAVLAVLS